MCDRPDIHIVIISAYGKLEYAQKALDLKACSYLLKPVSKIELFQTLVEIKNEIWKTKINAFETEQHEHEYYSMLLYEYMIGKNQLVNERKLYEGTGIHKLILDF